MPVVSISRLRMTTDGAGVTTLVVSHGCPLKCKYCINPFTWQGRTRAMLHTPQSLLKELEKDNLYFLATGGGVTFGGGEPLLHIGFISEFKRICPEEWRINIETSLNVEKDAAIRAAGIADALIVDIKDMDADIYRKYTGRDNAAVMENLLAVGELMPKENVRVRVPLIEGYNDEKCTEKSVKKLKNMGYNNVEIFKYVIR